MLRLQSSRNNNNNNTLRRKQHSGDIEECECSSDTSLTKSLSEEEESADDPAMIPTIDRKHHEANWLPSSQPFFPKTRQTFQNKRRYTIQIILWNMWRRRPRVALLSMFLIFLVLMRLFWTLSMIASPRLEIGPIPTRTEGQALVQRIRQTTIMPTGLTLHIRGSVVSVVHASILHYQACPIVQEIHVLDSPILPRRLWQEAKVTLSRTPHTTAVLLVDATIRLSCHDLENAWMLWKQDPTRLVGWKSSGSARSSSASTTTLLSDDALLGHWFIFEKYTTASFQKQLQQQLSSDSSTPACHHFALSAKWVAASQQAVVPMVASFQHDHFAKDVPQECYESLLRALGKRSLPSSTVLYTGYSPHERYDY